MFFKNYNFNSSIFSKTFNFDFCKKNYFNPFKILMGKKLI